MGGMTFDPLLADVSSFVVSDDIDEVTAGIGAGVSVNKKGALRSSFKDVNADGFIDLLFKVDTPDLAGFVAPGSSAIYVGGDYGSNPLELDTFVAVASPVRVFA